ncbi:MAG: MBL fold metallo-hydrolase, partial [Actinomycetota bacterium]|nr:MBL fold metallo-hydrolase [Actinomycetota bacterium]
MNTRFNVRKKVLGSLTPVRLAAKNGKTVDKGRGQDSDKRRPAATGPKTTAPIALDTGIFGQPGIMAAHLLPGDKPALIDTGPANTAGNVIDALTDLGVTRLDSIILTHAHVDHAGGAGRIADHFPEAIVYAPQRATRYLVQPSLLEDSARVWEGKADELFGTPVPIPADRVKGLANGDTVDLGGRRLQAIETPGHTRSHMVFLDLETDAMICGDALGIQLPGSRVIRPSTPPSDCTHEEAIASIEKMRSFSPASLHLAHFGESEQPPEPTFDR